MSLPNEPKTPTVMNTDLIGVVLCGGQSSRMGRDKGLILEGGVTWAARAGRVLATVCPRVVYSVNPQQVENYRGAMRGAELVVDTMPGLGPLGGLLAAHAKFSESDLLLLACDMLAIEEKHLQPLLVPGAFAVAYAHGAIFEPLCARYSAAACAELAGKIAVNLPGMSLQKFLRETNVTAVPVDKTTFLESRNFFRKT